MDSDLSFRGDNPGAVKYGNYINYYQFHPPETRIESLSTAPISIWNINNEHSEICVALDIGSNAGDLTKSLHPIYTKNIKCKNMIILGIDIDPKLIDRANENHKTDNILFQCLNIMDPTSKTVLTEFLKEYGKSRFDIISCFSTTMWIHLNNGDEGLNKFLNFICELGSLLIIEPQPWSRYREAVRRLKKESESFPMYEQLKIRSNVEAEIENVIMKTEDFQKLYETTSLGWARKVIFFRSKR